MQKDQSKAVTSQMQRFPIHNFNILDRVSCLRARKVFRGLLHSEKRFIMILKFFRQSAKWTVNFSNSLQTANSYLIAQSIALSSIYSRKCAIEWFFPPGIEDLFLSPSSHQTPFGSPSWKKCKWEAREHGILFVTSLFANKYSRSPWGETLLLPSVEDSIDSIHEGQLFYFCSIIVQIGLPSLTLGQFQFSTWQWGLVG